jgi:putative ATP-dependent endonuclease of OLD family
MRISRIQIENFRNFKSVDFAVGEHLVVVGENKAGKSNLIAALRLILDPALPETARTLRLDDFWDGLPRPLTRDDRIRISVDFTDFAGERACEALLMDYLVDPDGLVSRLTYQFGPSEDLVGEPASEAHYEFTIYGGAEDARRPVSPRVRQRLPLIVFPALRDVEDVLASWRRSPLRSMLNEAATVIGRDKLVELADEYKNIADKLAQTPEIAAIGASINERLVALVGASHAFPVNLGFTSSDPDRLIRAIRLLIDEKERGVGEASLGSANLLFLILKQLELDHSIRIKTQDHTFLAIEEPEAHLHPHVQRLLYRSLLQPRAHLPGPAPAEVPADAPPAERTFLLTTHSPHVVSVSPVRSLVVLRRSQDDSSVAVSTAELEIDTTEQEDLERYLDVTRGEIVFSRGVILVEGEAELYLLPVFANILGYQLDELGINVTSVAGTHFTPYAKLLGPSGLQIPFSIITDSDPRVGKTALGFLRAAGLLRHLASPDDMDAPEARVDHAGFTGFAAEHGIFLNEHTLEVDVFNGGQHQAMMTALETLSTNAAIQRRAREWSADPDTMNPSRMLKDIETVGKGRFAQRLASLIDPGSNVPGYIERAIRYVVDRVT